MAQTEIVGLRSTAGFPRYEIQFGASVFRVVVEATVLVSGTRRAGPRHA